MRLFVCFILAIAMLIVVAIELALTPLPSRTITFDDQHCSCAIPYNWIIKNQHRFLIEASRILGGTYLLAAQKASDSLDLTQPTFGDHITNDMKKRGHDIISSDHSPFQGHPAFTYTMHGVVNGHNIYTRSTTFVADGFQYTIVISKAGSDPEQDAALKAAEDSFTLLDSSVH